MLIELKQEVIRKVNEFVAVYEKTFSTTIPPIEIQYGLTGAANAGLAYTRYNMIKLHEEFLLKYQNEYIIDTVGHEVAHILTAHRFGHDVKHHGKEWKFIMAVLGLTPTRTHDYVSECKQKRHTKYKMSCSNCNMEIVVSQIIYNKMAKGKRYHSLCCKSPLIDKKEKLGKLSYLEAITQVRGQ
jgi:SprT protein